MNTTHRDIYMVRAPSSSQGQVEFGDTRVCSKTILIIATGSVNCLSSAYCQIYKCEYTGHDTWKQCCNDTMNTLEC
jgi:hypothetical protein